MARCEHPALTRRHDACRAANVRRACGHRVCDAHARDHAALCRAIPPTAARPRALTERDRMNAMSRALGCPSPYGDF